MLSEERTKEFNELVANWEAAKAKASSEKKKANSYLRTLHNICIWIPNELSGDGARKVKRILRRITPRYATECCVNAVVRNDKEQGFDKGLYISCYVRGKTRAEKQRNATIATLLLEEGAKKHLGLKYTPNYPDIHTSSKPNSRFWRRELLISASQYIPACINGKIKGFNEFAKEAK